MAEHKDPVPDAEAQLRVLRLLQTNPLITQREMAGELGVSLGKANYCLKELLRRGLVEIQSVSGLSKKMRNTYLLTPSGRRAKTRLTQERLKIKLAEYRSLKREIELLRAETSRAPANGGHP